MARSKNSLTDVSPSSGQLKQKFSYLERTQLNALSKTSGSLGYGAGKINGNVSNSLVNYSLRDRSKLEIGGLFAEGLEKSGISGKSSASVISSVVNSSIDNRTPFYRNVYQQQTDLSIAANRTPSSNKSSPDQRMKERRADLVGREDYSYNGLEFPSELKQSAHAYLHLKLFRYERPLSNEQGKVLDAENIYLPLPEQLVQEFNANYGEQDQGAVAAFITGNSDTAAQNRRDLKQIASNLGSGNDLLTGVGGEDGLSFDDLRKRINNVATYAGFRTLSGVSPALGGLAGQIRGAVANPHPTAFLNGINLRTINFTWKLVPRSKAEAKELKKIIDLIKTDCLPKKYENFLTYPKMILPKVVTTGRNDFAYDYKKSMLQSLSINYSGEGTSAFFVDGNPVCIELSLGLQEMEIVADDIDKATFDELTNIDVEPVDV